MTMWSQQNISKTSFRFDRLLDTYLDYTPPGFLSFLKATPIWMKEKLWMSDVIGIEFGKVAGAEDELSTKNLLTEEV